MSLTVTDVTPSPNTRHLVTTGELSCAEISLFWQLPHPRSLALSLTGYSPECDPTDRRNFTCKYHMSNFSLKLKIVSSFPLFNKIKI